MEYEDAPSGYVTLYNYKSPFMKFEGGFGLQGVLLYDGKEDKIQCHFCGDWFDHLPSHIHKEHNMRAADYKEQVGLLQSTCLLSESEREKLLRNIDTRKANLVPGGGGQTSAQKAKTSNTLHVNGSKREQQNKLGTCPAQLIDRLQRLAAQLGHSPRRRDCTFTVTLQKVFGSFNEATRLAGMTPRKVGENLNHRPDLQKVHATDAALLEEMRAFKERSGRYPSKSAHARGLMLHTYSCFAYRFGSYRAALTAAFPELAVQSSDENHAPARPDRQSTPDPVLAAAPDGVIPGVPQLAEDGGAHSSQPEAQNAPPSLVRVPTDIPGQDLPKG